MENINFRGIPTSLFLNGPKLGIVTDPQSVSDSIGVATFTGIATATFPDTNFSLDGGSIAFKWYFDGSLISDDEGTKLPLIMQQLLDLVLQQEQDLQLL